MLPRLLLYIADNCNSTDQQHCVQGIARLDAALARVRANAAATPPSPPRTPGQARAPPPQPEAEQPGGISGLVRCCTQAVTVHGSALHMQDTCSSHRAC